MTKNKLIKEEDSKTMDDYKLEGIRLKNLKLKLGLWKEMKSEGFTLDEARDAMNGKKIKPIEAGALEHRFDTIKPGPTDWQHICKSVGRVVTLPLSFNACTLCEHVKSDEDPRA